MRSQATALTIALLALSSSHAVAAPPRGLPVPKGVKLKQNGGYTYNCQTHDKSGGGEWDKYALDMRVGESGANTADKVATMTDGRVVQKNTSNTSALGYYITIDHGGFFSRYAHFDEAADPEVGDRVRAGQIIGREGGSGGWAPHLHFQWGTGSNYSGATAAKFEPLTAEESNDHQAFIPTVASPSVCTQSTSKLWYGSRPLSDVFAVKSSGTWETRLAKGDGDFGAATTGTMGSKFEYVKGHFNDDSQADLFLFDPTTGSYQFLVAKVDPPLGQQGFDTLSTGTSSWLRRDPGSPGSPGLPPIIPPTPPTPPIEVSVYPAVLDYDGHTDLIIHRTNGQYRVWRPNGAGGFNVGQSGTFTQADWPLATGYFTNDMLTDFVRYDPTGTGWATWKATGSGNFSQQHSGNFSSSNRQIQVGEFNDDGYQDLYRYAVGGVAWETFTGGTSGNWSSYSSGNWGVTRTDYLGHFDDDLMTDIFRYNSSTGVWNTKRANGSGGWVNDDGTVASGREVHLAYLDGDMRTDLLLYSKSTGTATVLLSDSANEGDFKSNSYNQAWPTNSDIHVDHYNDF